MQWAWMQRFVGGVGRGILGGGIRLPLESIVAWRAMDKLVRSKAHDQQRSRL
jgi:hypothetical protein